MEPTKAVCCVCDRSLPENQGTFDKESEGSLFICNDCQAQEDRVYPISDEPIYPVDEGWDEGQEDDNDPQWINEGTDTGTEGEPGVN